MKRLYIIIFYGALFFSSCSDYQKNIHVVSLPDAVELISESKRIGTELLLPTKIFIKEDKLIIFEPLSKGMFKVFDFPSLKYLYSYGDNGRGPNEFISVSSDDIIENSAEFVEIFDVNKLDFVVFSDSSARIISQTPISLLHLKNPINRLKKINDSIYYFDNLFEEDNKNEFTRLNVRSGDRTYFSAYPDWAKNIKSPMDKFQTYSKFSRSNSFDNKMVVFYYSFPVIKFLDLDGNIMKEIHVDTQQSIIREPSNDNIFYFLEYPVFTDEFIYVFWVEKSKNDIMNHSENFKPEILVFDWDGNVAGRYKLDQPITSFTLSEETGKIYCTPFPGENVINIIYVYDLPKIKNEKMSLARIENSLYSLNILDGYDFSQGSKQDGVDKIIEKNGLKTNVNYFVQVRDKNGFAQHDLESIQIRVCSPVGETQKDWPNFLINTRTNWENIKRRKIIIDGLNVVQTTFYINSLNPKNEVEQLYVNSYFFEKNNVFIEITIYSKRDNFSSYHPAFKNMIRSFELKD